MRDVELGTTFDCKFTTTDPETGAPATLSGTPTIAAYVGNSTTEITAGITLTVDFDGRTGLNNVRVVATTGNGFADNTDVSLVITAGTVAGNSAVGYVIEQFTIGKSPAYRRLGASGAGLTNIPWNGSWDPHVGKVVSGTLSGTHSSTTADLGTNAPTVDISGQTIYFPDHQISRVISSYNTSTGVATFGSVPVTLANGNAWYLFATAPSAGGGGLDAAGVREAIGLSSADLDDQLSALQDVLDALEADTQDLQTQIGTAGAGLTNIPWNAEWDAEVQSECADALSAYDPPTNAEMEARTLESASYATASAVQTIDDELAVIDTVVDRIEVDTQDIQSRLPAALNNGVMPCDVQRINDVKIEGDGAETPFGVS